MNSAERREVRYQRRKALRDKRRMELAEKYADPNKVFKTSSIVKGFKKTSRNSKWKASTQRYGHRLFINARKESRELLNGTWRTKGFYEFDIVERGKPRHIQSVKISEKSVQAAFSNECLVPILSRSLIYDNGASLPGKGPDFTISRFIEHLKWHIDRFGLTGGIYFYDFSSYFDSIPHAPLTDVVYHKVLNDRIMQVYRLFLDAVRKPDEIFAEARGLGLGSQVFQISAVFYPNEIDHYVKDTLGIHGYARYMDDGYIISESIDRLKQIKEKFEALCISHGLKLNKSKCRIIKFHKPFIFLKNRFKIISTGKIVIRIDRKKITKEHKKLKLLKTKLINGLRTFKEVNLEFYAWLCSHYKYDTYHAMKNMIEYFNNLFKDFGTFYIPTKKLTKRNRKRIHGISYMIRSLSGV